jgi:hypothetical protein
MQLRADAGEEEVDAAGDATGTDDRELDNSPGGVVSRPSARR